MQRLIAFGLVGALLLTLFFTACSSAPAPAFIPLPATTTIAPSTRTPTPQPTAPPNPIGAFESGWYRNLFAELLGKSEAEVQRKIERACAARAYAHT